MPHLLADDAELLADDAMLLVDDPSADGLGSVGTFGSLSSIEPIPLQELADTDWLGNLNLGPDAAAFLLGVFDNGGLEPLGARHDGVDRESTESEQNVGRAQTAVAELIADLREVSAEQAPNRLSEPIADAIRGLLDRLERGDSITHAERGALAVERAGGTVLQNARWALDRPSMLGDMSDGIASVRTDRNTWRLADGTLTTTGTVADLVWRRIQRIAADGPDGSQRMAQLESDFARALGQCINDDGTRVCANGVIQRLTNVLGRELNTVPRIETATPTPNELISYLSLRHQSDLLSGSERRANENDQHFATRQRETVQAFLSDVTAAARESYVQGDPRRAATLEQARSLVISLGLPAEAV